MSHHFDTKLAREDPSLNLCDFYLFDGPSGKTVMAMTVNPNVRLSAPDTLHPEGLYAFGGTSFALGPAYGYASLLNDPSDQEAKEQFNASVPSEDLERFAKSIADFAEKMTTYAGSAADPGEYGKLIAARLCPDTLPYELGTSAAFEVASFNGRALGDDVLDVMLTLAANMPIVDELAPDHGRIRKDFPYYGSPYTAEEQVR